MTRIISIALMKALFPNCRLGWLGLCLTVNSLRFGELLVIPVEMRIKALPKLSAGTFRLRSFYEKDAGLVFDAAVDPYIPQITSIPQMPTADSALAFVRRQIARFHDGEGYSFAIVRDEDDVACGQIGLWPDQSRSGVASVGYWLAPEARGKGAATASLLAICDWGLINARVKEIELFVEEANAPSIEVAERAQFRFVRIVPNARSVNGQMFDMRLYVRSAD